MYVSGKIASKYNMKMKFKIMLLVLFGNLWNGVAWAQQNIQFSQYIFNSLSVNPAYAGYKEEWFAQMAYRTQWTGVNGAPETGQLSVDGIVDPDRANMGVGLQLTYDKLGVQGATSIYGNYAYRLRLDAEDTQRLSFGIGVGATQYTLNGAQLDPDSPFDPTLPAGRVNNWIPDIRLGTYYYNTKWYAGISLMDLLSGDETNDLFRWDSDGVVNIQRKRHMYLMGGAMFNLESDLKLRPSILWKEDFKGPSSVDLNAMFIFADRFWIGGSYRTGVRLLDREYSENQNLSSLNSVSGIAQMYVTERLRIGYSYDYMINSFGNSGGTHEITLGLTFGQRNLSLLSPRFF